MIIVVDQRKIWKRVSLNWKMLFIIVFIASMFFSIGMMYSPDSGCIDNGKVDLSSVDFKQNELIDY